jgi:hypothetical protein
MLVRLTPIKFSSDPHLVPGARLEADIRRRVRELEARHCGALTAKDKRELARLRDLLRLAKNGDGADD